MPEKKTTGVPLQDKQFKIKWSLSFTVVLGLILLISIPVTVMGLATYFRSRDLMTEQASNQLNTIIQTQSLEASQIAAATRTYLDELLNDSLVRDAIDRLVNEADDANAYLTAYQLNGFRNRTPLFGTTYADQISIILPNGRILISTKADLANQNINQVEPIKQLLGTDTATTSFDIQGFAPDQYTLLATRVFKSNPPRSLTATILVSAQANRLSQLLLSSMSLFPEANAHFITSNGQSIGFSIDDRETLRNLSWHDEHYEYLQRVFASPEREGFTDYGTVDRGHVFAYAKWIPSLKTGLVLEVPQTIVFQQVDALVPFTSLLITIAILVAAVLAFIGSRFLTRPLVQLAAKARRFANGDWSQRAPVNRSDEIGLLAASFNNMVEQISDLYRSMENRVEQRSQQIRTASEIGQIATSSSSREEIVQKTASLVLERFGYPLAAIALIEESGLNAVITAAQSSTPLSKDLLGKRIPINDSSLVGWVARHNQARVVTTAEETNAQFTSEFQSGSRSALAMPIAIGNRVLGVFEVQDTSAQGFDNETLSVLQTLCNQVANGLQNMRLLEATQINLEETSLLYRASRQITMTQNEPELLKVFTETLIRTPFVSAVFFLQADYLGIQTLVDPRSQQPTATTQGITLPLRNISTLLTDSRLVIIEDLSVDSEYANLLSFFVRRGCRTAAIFPIKLGEKLSRVVVLGSREPLSLTETSLQPYSNLIEVITTTLERFRIHETLQQRVNELQTIATVSQAISAETDIYQLYHLLHQQVMQIIGSDIGFLVANYSPRDNLIHIPYIFENGELLSINPFPLGEGLTSHLIKSRQPLMMVKNTEAQTRQLGAKIIGKTAKSWLGVPLILGNDVLGAIVLQDTDKEERFTETDLALFNTLAPQVATAIRNAQLLTEMQQALHAYDQERFLLNTLLENIPEQVFFKDADGRYIRVSQSYARSIGLQSPEQAVHQTDQQLLESQTAERNQSEFDTVLTSRQPIQTQEKALQDEKTIWTDISRIPMLDQENLPVGILGINRDISELKQAEELAQHRALHLSIAQEIARDTSSTLETNVLLRNATQMIRDRFGFYHSSIFLLDALGEYAELRESTGEVGERMKSLHHRLAVGSQSLVGQATASGQPVIINDVAKYQFYYANPLLPDTRSELVIPLKVGERIIGAIDVQSTQLNAFVEEDVKILTILADQLAIAIYNAVLFTDSQTSLSQHRLIHQITVSASSKLELDDALSMTVKTLQEKRQKDRVAIYLLNASNQLELKTEAGFDEHCLAALTYELDQGVTGKSAQSLQQVLVKDSLNEPGMETPTLQTRSILATPITFANRLIGVLYSENPEPVAYHENDLEIYASLANTLGAIISNARLVEAVRLQVERQRRLFDVTNRIRQTLDMKSIMEVSASEIARAVNARRARIDLSIGEVNEPQIVRDGNGYHDEEKRS